jgi:hypothetical protein
LGKGRLAGGRTQGVGGDTRCIIEGSSYLLHILKVLIFIVLFYRAQPTTVHYYNWLGANREIIFKGGLKLNPVSFKALKLMSMASKVIPMK